MTWHLLMIPTRTVLPCWTHCLMWSTSTIRYHLCHVLYLRLSLLNTWYFKFKQPSILMKQINSSAPNTMSLFRLLINHLLNKKLSLNWKTIFSRMKKNKSRAKTKKFKRFLHKLRQILIKSNPQNQINHKYDHFTIFTSGFLLFLP